MQSCLYSYFGSKLLLRTGRVPATLGEMIVIDSRTLALMVRQGLITSIADLIFLMDDAYLFAAPDLYEEFLVTRLARDGCEWAITLSFVGPYWYMFELMVPITYFGIEEDAIAPAA